MSKYMVVITPLVPEWGDKGRVISERDAKKFRMSVRVAFRDGHCAWFMPCELETPQYVAQQNRRA